MGKIIVRGSTQTPYRLDIISAWLAACGISVGFTFRGGKVNNKFAWAVYCFQ